MLRHAESVAVERGVRDQCTFLQCSAEKLEDVPDRSVDVVTTRAVLAYVADKPAALREFHRVLKPGGRLSIAEPIFRDDALKAIELKKLADAQQPGSQDRTVRLLHRWKAAQFPDTEEQMAQSPITNYSERDLVRFVNDSCFAEIHLAFHIEILPSNITSWDVFLGFSPHPWAPSLSLILAEQFTAEERQIFEQFVRPIVEAGQFTTTDRMAYLTARKPPA
jgi:ubiquinone/menaquinone biosynthesis C-methylase UbiE